MVKVERSFPAPESLAIEAKKQHGSYTLPDVIARLRNDFHDKCYICELKELQDPQVDHLLPHKNRKLFERVFDWDNLFWSCGHCNQVKNKDKYDSGIIDCCREDPEEKVVVRLIGDDISAEAIDSDDSKSVLTAQLIYETFNQKNTGIREAACDMRMKALTEDMNNLYRELEKYKHNPESKRNCRVIKVLLKRESAFAAFKRGYVRERLDEYPGLAECV
jgi:hypothetical protein